MKMKKEKFRKKIKRMKQRASLPPSIFVRVPLIRDRNGPFILRRFQPTKTLKQRIAEMPKHLIHDKEWENRIPVGLEVKI